MRHYGQRKELSQHWLVEQFFEVNKELLEEALSEDIVIETERDSWRRPIYAGGLILARDFGNKVNLFSQDGGYPLPYGSMNASEAVKRWLENAEISQAARDAIRPLWNDYILSDEVLEILREFLGLDEI